MSVRSLMAVVVVSLLLPTQYTTGFDDLVAEESHRQPPATHVLPQPRRYSSQIKASDGGFGQKTSPKKNVLDFRIESLRESAAGGGERPTVASKTSKDDEEEKTLAQQVADGKYGLIQNELFPQGAKRPGIISYKDNPEVPADTADNLGGLDKEEIWLAEDHVLVLRGGAFPQNYNQTYPTPYPPIDDYIAPTRQVQIPKNPKIPPPFPVQLSENGPLQFIRGENGSFPPRPPFFPPLPPPNASFPFPVPPGQGPPFLPPGAAFLPPVGNLTDFDEDDPSIYYPPKYDFNYPQDNATAVPPGPLVPGIILPPPPNFFTEERPNEEENETDGDVPPPYVGPAYLPSEKRPYSPPRNRQPLKRPTRPQVVHTVYPEPNRIKTTTQSAFTSPIYVPNTPPRSNSRPHMPLPTTSPRPNHISIPKNKTLTKDIYIISTEPPDIANDIIDIIRESKPNRPTSLEGISADRHPLRSLIRPQVSVNYIGKVGHLPPSTAFPFPRTEPPTTTPTPPGHFITFPPTLSVTAVPAIKKFQIKSTEPPQNANPSHATFFYFEEPTQATPAHENDVSASPIDDFLKSHLQDQDFYQYRQEKTTQASPVYIPSRSRPKSTRKPYLAPAEDPLKLNGLDNDLALHAGLETLPPLPATPTPTTATDGPFIPSNYYATANPANMHFTKFDPTIVDDITMKYFTIFGQKLGNGGTTPLTPGVGTTPRTHVVQAYTPRTTTTTSRPITPITITTSRPAKHYRPQQSNFEQFLHEITGEDQSNYIVTHKTPVKVKKPKSRPVYTDEAPKIHHYYLPYRPGGFSEYIEGIYRGSTASTSRPVSDVQLKPEYQTTARPYVQIQTQQPPPYRPKPLSHNLGQYLQEVVYPAAGPQTPPRTSNLQFFPQSLHSDILVNYRQPLPPINPQAEQLPSSYVDASSSHSNIKVVQSPNLSQRPRPHSTRTFFENLPQSGYFRQPQSNNANAFVAYNLPEETGHFYFLTPQARSDSKEEEEEENGGPADRLNHRQPGRRNKHA